MNRNFQDVKVILLKSRKEKKECINMTHSASQVDG